MKSYACIEENVRENETAIIIIEKHSDSFHCKTKLNM